MDTQENNKMIAEFMNYPDLGTEGDFSYLKYHTSWDWLMLVVEKIESIELNDSNSTNYYDVCIMPDAVLIGLQSDDLENPLILINKSEGVGSINHHVHLFEKKRDAVYNAVVEFIEWYNEQNRFICGVCGEHVNEYTYNEDKDVDECNKCK